MITTLFFSFFYLQIIIVGIGGTVLLIRFQIVYSAAPFGAQECQERIGHSALAERKRHRSNTAACIRRYYIYVSRLVCLVSCAVSVTYRKDTFLFHSCKIFSI